MRGWVQAALEIYPADVVAFYGKEKNSFANPVGAATTAGIEGLFDALVTDAPPGEFVPHLDRILQVRCVQGFPLHRRPGSSSRSRASSGTRSPAS